MSMLFNPALCGTETYKITALQDTAAQLMADGHPIINATIGDPKDDTPSNIPSALVQSLTRPSFSQYPSYIGQESLRGAISDWAKRTHGCVLDPASQILACNGTKEAIFSLPLLLDKSSNQQILMSSLAYPVYQMSADYFQVPTCPLPMNEDAGFLPIIDDVSVACLKQTHLVWLNSPHNPTTAVASDAYLRHWVQLAEKYNFLVCSDECYNDLYEEDIPASVLDIDSAHWVCFRSLSKRSHMTGYRSGAIISKNTTLMTHLKKMRSPMGVGTPSFIQDAATWAWTDDHHVIGHRTHYNQKRQRVRSALTTAGFTVFGSTAGFYFWVKHSDHATSDALAEWFLHRDILVTPGTVFGADGNPYIRLVFCLRDDVLDALIQRLVA